MTASLGVPPTKRMMAGAVAIAKPPMPAVSVMVLSPRSGLASASVYPGNHSPSTGGAGAVNQRSPRPLTRMPKSVPLRAIALTMVHPSIPWATSAIALQAAITGLSTLRAFSPKKRRTSEATSASLVTLTMCGANRAVYKIEPASLRLCPSSPIFSERESKARMSIPPLASMASARTGAITSSIQRRRSSTSSLNAP